MKHQNLYLLVLITSLFILKLGAQNSKDSLYTIWKDDKNTPQNRAYSYNNLIHNNYLNSKPDSAYIMAKELLEFSKKHRLKEVQADAFITLGNTKKVIGDLPKSLRLYQQGLEIYESIQDKSGTAVALSNIGALYSMEYDFNTALEFYEKSLKLNEEVNDSINICGNLIKIGNVYGNKFKIKIASDYYFKALKLAKTINHLDSQGTIYGNLGNINLKQEKYNDAITYFKKGFKIAKQTNNLNTQMHTLYFISFTYLNQKKYDDAIAYAELSLELTEKLDNISLSASNYKNLHEAYKSKGNLKMAMTYLEESTSLNNALKEYDLTKQLQQIEIDKIRMRDSLVRVEQETKTALLHEKEILEKNQEKTNLTIGWLGSLSFVTLIGYLIFKNIKRKQKKAEKERQDQIDEKEKILKDLELTTIDAMIEGQEKERERLAADLHDSVGATLAAAKLQFEYLITTKNDINSSQDFIKKTSTLLEDAYVEIRSMAHLKNSGVMAKNGLLPAVEKLSLNASGINGLTFEVKSYGLEQRLENTLEISVFRIIQELITNIIKHANATKGLIHLTNHDDNLNIMIEDNGIGFNPNLVTKSNTGMGIHSIDKRVEHLDGKLTIESEKHKGTTVIIDLPI